MSAQQPIQAGVTQVRPFSQIIAESGDKWTGLKPDQKLEVLNGYLDNRATKDQSYGQLDDKQKLDVKAGFISKYVFNQPDEAIAKMQPQGGNAGDFAMGALQGLGNAGQFLLKENPLEAVSGLGQSLQNLATGNTQGAQKQVQDFNRLSDVTQSQDYQRNNSFRTGADIGNTAGNLAQYVVGGAAGPLGVAAVSANQNAQRVTAGQQNVGQAAYNTGLDTLLGKFAPQAQTLIGAALKNAGVGALGGAAGAVGNQVLTGQRIDPRQIIEAAQRSALEGGAIGAGFHAAHAQPSVPNARNAPTEPTVPRELSDNRLDANAITRQSINTVRQVRNMQSTDRQSTVAKQVKALKTQYETLSQVANDRGTPQEVRTRLETIKASILKEHNALQGELGTNKKQRSEYAQATRVAKERAQAATGRQNQRQALNKVIEDGRSADLKASIAREKELTAQHKTAIAEQRKRQADLARTQNLKDKQAIQGRIALEKAEGIKRAKELKQLRAGIQENAKLQNQKDAQTAQGNRALDKGEAQNRARELKHLKGDIQSRHREISEENPIKGEVSNAVDDTPDQHRENLQKAIDAGKPVRLDYRAERAGSRDESTFRQKFDKPYELGTDGSGDYVRVVNENGRFSKRYLDSIRGTVQPSEERFPFTTDREGLYSRGQQKGERGRARVLDEDFNEVLQGKSRLTRDSTLEKSLKDIEDLVNRAKTGKASVQEIMNLSHELDVEQLAKVFKELPQNKRAELHEKITGEPC